MDEVQVGIINQIANRRIGDASLSVRVRDRGNYGHGVISCQPAYFLMLSSGDS